MNRDKLLMCTALLMACAGFLMLGRSVQAGPSCGPASSAEIAMLVR